MEILANFFSRRRIVSKQRHCHIRQTPSKLAKRWGLSRPIIKSHAEEKWAWPWVGELPKILEFPLIFLQQPRLAISNLVGSLGLPRAIIKSHPKEKSGRGPGLGTLPKILGFPLIFLQRLKLRLQIWFAAWVCQGPS